MLQEDIDKTKIILNLSIRYNDLSFQFRADLTAHARKTLDSTEHVYLPTGGGLGYW